ncbi:MAG: hypothetical protein WCJ29_02700 [bacterium]
MEKEKNFEAFVEGAEKSFLQSCKKYDTLRLQLFTVEKKMLEVHEPYPKNLVEKRDALMEEIREIREAFLPIISELKEVIGNSEANKKLVEWIAKRSGAGKFIGDTSEFARKMLESAVFAAYRTPASLIEKADFKRTPSPYEAILATIRIEEESGKIADALKESATSVAQVGSSGWGANFTIRGKDIKDPLGLETMPTREGKDVSDIDMLVFSEGPEAIQRSVDTMVSRGLLTKNEIERVKRFTELYETGEADIFSAYSKIGGLDQSFLFISKAIAKKLLEAKNEKETESVSEFRLDEPVSYKVEGGYSIDDISGNQIGMFFKQPQKITSKSGKTLGFIANRPCGGPMESTDGRKVFATSILTRQLMSLPKIIIDKDNFLKKQLEQYLKSVKKYIGNNQEIKILRWEKMPSEARKKIASLIRESDK